MAATAVMAERLFFPTFISPKLSVVESLCAARTTSRRKGGYSRNEFFEGLRDLIASNLIAGALRHRRSGGCSLRVRGFSGRNRTEFVAGIAARPYRIRRFALPVFFGLRGKHAADQSGG